MSSEKGEPGPADSDADAHRPPSEAPDDESVDYPVDFGIPIALDREVSCPHGFDPPYCPFGCA